jgi:outer membrane protein assembly factor BamB
MNYKGICKAIADLGYQGYLSHEYTPTKDPLETLDKDDEHLRGDGKILASCYGEIFCLDPLTGDTLWHNPLKGFGVGLAAIATEHNVGSGNAPVLAEKRRRDEEAAASGAVVATTATSA